MSNEQQPALEPTEVKEIDFYGDSITAALVKVDNIQQVYIPLRAICEYLGLDWASQYQRIKRSELLGETIISVVVMTTEKGKGRGRREVIALPLEMLPGWLFGIDANRVKSELKPKILRYQRECFKVLWQAFQQEALAVTDIDPFAVEPKDYQPSQVLVQIRENALAIAEMARQQIELERRVDHAHDRLDTAGKVVKNLQHRMNTVEARLDAQPNYITDRQASDVSQKVKDLAARLANSNPGSHYKPIFDEIYKRFHVASYKQLTREQYPAVLEFLNNWHDDPNTPKQGNLF